MADLATAKAGEEVTLSNGKVIISDGKGGGRVKRAPKKGLRQMEKAPAPKTPAAPVKVVRKPENRTSPGTAIRRRQQELDEALKQQ